MKPFWNWKVAAATVIVAILSGSWPASATPDQPAPTAEPTPAPAPAANGKAYLTFRHDGPHAWPRTQRLLLRKDEKCGAGLLLTFPSAVRNAVYKSEKSLLRLKTDRDTILLAQTVTNYGQSYSVCANLGRFRPEPGGRYTLFQRASAKDCHLELIDDATGQAPPSFTPLTTANDCATF